jgi:hypothetical protein
MDCSTIDGRPPCGELLPLEPSRAHIAVTVLSVVAMLFLAIVIVATDPSPSTPVRVSGYSAVR